MNSVFDEIYKLRKGRPIAIDYQNTNRYRIVTKENDGTKTAYCFGVPIYNSNTRKLVDLKFKNDGKNCYSVGSNADITLSETAVLRNDVGSCSITFTERISAITEKVVCCNNAQITPTVNGLAFKVPCSTDEKIAVKLTTDRPFMDVRANSKYFALMCEKFKPFVTVSCIGSMGGDGTVVAPCKISFQKITDTEFSLTLSPTSPFSKYILYEINLYESKLFQDTTVESMNPKENNAFGTIAFIGNTAAYGEQWLYSRPDFSLMQDMYSHSVNKAVLHLPRLNNAEVPLSANKVSSRFCSFGSKWENKVAIADKFADADIVSGYHSLDITPLITEGKSKGLTMSEGMILRTKIKNSGFTVIATGDSYYAPQILEINYK